MPLGHVGLVMVMIERYLFVTETEFFQTSSYHQVL